MNSPGTLIIFGTRGVPAAHGGFETFAEHLALFLAERGWHVVVYCQREVSRVEHRVTTDVWHGIERRHISVASTGTRATLEFDWHCVLDAAAVPGICLVLGYNSAIFLAYLRLKRRRIITNMDGIEWRRKKWRFPARAWLWTNEWLAAWLSHRMIADHPVIARHLATRRNPRVVSMIPYGGTRSDSESDAPVHALGLPAGRYLLCIARIEPDNSVLEIVEAFSRRARGTRLVVLGRMVDNNNYHQCVRAAASDEVLFAGAIYDKAVVAALRCHARAYLHGHTVGGTNPSLVEALWAGNAVIAHDNPYNRWTAGDAGRFFHDVDSCEREMQTALADDALIAHARHAALLQAERHFKWSDILEAYEQEALSLMSGDGEPRNVDAPARQTSEVL